MGNASGLLSHGVSVPADILIADEPTTALDVTTQAEILALINELKEVYNNATLFITHDFGVVADIADRVAVMCQGKIIEQGAKSEILLKPKERYTKLLVDAMPLMETQKEPDQSRNDAPVVKVKKLSKTYRLKSKSINALINSNFTLRRGETLGVVGESGSGKSTLAKTVIRLIEPTSGSVLITSKISYLFKTQSWLMQGEIFK